MAARKLQSEIDRTLKRVKEGVEEFENLYEKLQVSQNQAQKEKMESDLKTMIKKLQRLRDQIKTWLQSNDIKDKKALLDNRKLIETQMERFKAVEKEMKTKAFSKEGLIAAAKLDPAERAKVEATNWISSQVDELARQVEMTEAEIEQLASSGKRSKKSATGGKDERVGQLDSLNDRRNWHVSRLEILLRLVENGQIEPDRVGDIKDDVAYFVESNAEEDFEEDEGIYDDFNLDEEEEQFGLKDNDDINSSHDSMSVIDEPKTPTKRKDSDDGNSSVLKALTENAKKASVTSTDKKPARSVDSKSSAKDDGKEPVVPPANFSKGTNALPPSAVAASPSKPGAPAALPPIRYAAAAAAAVAPVAPAGAVTNLPSNPPNLPPLSNAASTPSATSPVSIPAAATPSPSSAVTAATNNGEAEQVPGPAAVAMTVNARVSPAPQTVDTVANGTSTAPSVSTPMSVAASVVTGAASSPLPQYSAISSLANGSGSSVSARGSPSLAHRSAASLASPSPSHASAAGPPPGIASSEPLQLAATSAAAAALQPSGGGAGTLAQRRQGTDGARLPSSLSDLVSSFESAKQKSLLGENNMDAVHKSLEASFMNVPEPLDSEKPKYYVPQNPYPTPAYYPQQPLAHLDNPALFAKLDVDTLFYAFYFMPHTYQQYLAAQELKKQSWRFHQQYLTWFQRHSEPNVITDAYERGAYIYFDFEGTWCQRKKSDFTFEYRWLEESS
ncbi:hypothetical protein K437DRAFT_256443 [Tilletiaria anomala UBC 951]|uniref:General negative regulator of transcription subunit n=1 Tax=Tilletiaria anomala (strain ATCC 24038 / CBS 436.72 / UBC 951) TaxID=1037660 RepID=A0A066W4D4_TILAU|nr:uncharacterized protein K437DRAFT_256443 [Tilletiaria anomala UBC 951]KDN45924.1 hypothetical protein K437DRAFT_256443 [Tilletiaria anomala UBC 951]